MSYFCGVIRFGSCLYWSRTTTAELNELRFYYVMAVSSVLKLNAYDILGGSCCKNMSVSSDNKNYINLLKMADCPTIKKMAMIDSVSAIKQVQDLIAGFDVCM